MQNAPARQRLGALLYAALALLAACFLAILTFGYTTDSPIAKDAGENTIAAYHLAHTGIMGGDALETDNPTPQMRREPLPIAVTALYLLLHPDFAAFYTVAELTDGPLTRSAKGVNAFWRFLIAIFVFLLCRELFSRPYVAAGAALLCLVLSEVSFLSTTPIVDRLYTELPASALLLAASWCAVRFVRHKNWGRAALLGVALGLLALTKASLLYVGIGFTLLLFVMDAIRLLRRRPSERGLGKLLAIWAALYLALFATVGPWIARNAIIFDKPQISSRGEIVLGIRATLMQYPFDKLLYFFSPGGLRGNLLGPLLGYDAVDLKPRGELHELVVAKDRFMQVIAEREADGRSGDDLAWIFHMAQSYVTEHPIRYIASIPLFAYKGMWFMQEMGLAFNALVLLCFLGVFFCALIAGNQVLVAAFGLPVGSFLFISAFSHALIRYNKPLVPFAVLAALWLLVFVAQTLSTRWRLSAKLQAIRGLEKHEPAPPDDIHVRLRPPRAPEPRVGQLRMRAKW